MAPVSEANTSVSQPRMTIAEIEALMDRYFTEGRRFTRIASLGDRELVLRMPYRTALVRAGGTISGPAMMALADTAAYYLVLAYAGPVPEAATANLDIHFLSRPRPADMLATARLLRLGRRLAVATVDIRSDGGDEIVAHATVTYALPRS
jgi:uncharacterized protein (TIGR00369 family)